MVLVLSPWFVTLFTQCAMFRYVSAMVWTCLQITSFFYFTYRCIQKKYIVLATTALSMLLALTTAIILTINVFHVTDSQHNHARHFHGDQGKTADSAEMYQKASIASDSGNCSRIGKFDCSTWFYLKIIVAESILDLLMPVTFLWKFTDITVDWR